MAAVAGEGVIPNRRAALGILPALSSPASPLLPTDVGQSQHSTPGWEKLHTGHTTPPCTPHFTGAAEQRAAGGEVGGKEVDRLPHRPACILPPTWAYTLPLPSLTCTYPPSLPTPPHPYRATYRLLPARGRMDRSHGCGWRQGQAAVNPSACGASRRKHYVACGRRRAEGKPHRRRLLLAPRWRSAWRSPLLESLHPVLT